eukprot:15470589-Alexandrium_andersonii.AAC.1
MRPARTNTSMSFESRPLRAVARHPFLAWRPRHVRGAERSGCFGVESLSPPGCFARRAPGTATNQLSPRAHGGPATTGDLAAERLQQAPRW